MARPKLNQNGVMEMDDQLDAKKEMKKAIKHVFRGISKTGLSGEDGSQPAYVIEEYLGKFFEEGFELKFAYQIGQNETMVQMLYILVRE